MAENNDGDESAQQQQHRACKRAFKSPLRRGAAAVPRGKAITAAAVSFFMVSGPPLSKREREEREGEPNPDCEDNIPMSKKRERGIPNIIMSLQANVLMLVLKNARLNCPSKLYECGKAKHNLPSKGELSLFLPSIFGGEMG